MSSESKGADELGEKPKGRRGAKRRERSPRANQPVAEQADLLQAATSGERDDMPEVAGDAQAPDAEKPAAVAGNAATLAVPAVGDEVAGSTERPEAVPVGGDTSEAQATSAEPDQPTVQGSAPAAAINPPTSTVDAADPATDRQSRVPRELMAAAMAESAASGIRVVDIVEAKLGMVPADFVATLGRTFGLDCLSMDALNVLEADFEALPFAQAAQRECLAMRDASGQLLAVIGEPFDGALRSWAEAVIEEPFEWRLAHSADLRALLSRHEESMRAMDSVLESGQSGAGLDDDGTEALSIASISEGDSPAVKLVSSTIYDALRANTSDIHIETGANGLTIKYRLDGVLATLGNVQGSDLADQVLSRIKVMAELDISERRVPQDGRFKVLIKGRAVDFRVSIMPSIHGEDAVLRILDKHTLVGEQQALRLDSLGFDDGVMARIRALARKPYGMLLVTGPTGSGKSTTLYAALTEINSGQDKIITIEDPVEYQLNGVLQIPVNEKKGLTFSRGLRSILRHDPDTILIGEMRDAETAQIAVQAALTGHLVFSTVHANNVFDVISRSMAMGLEPYAFVSALNGIVAQRLMRKTCTECAIEQAPDDDLLLASGLTREQVRDFTFKVGRGCGHCRGTGYQGRKAIAEILLVNDEIREMILRGEPVRRLRETAAANGTRSLRESALESVRRGETTLQEINRVTFVA